MRPMLFLATSAGLAFATIVPLQAGQTTEPDKHATHMHSAEGMSAETPVEAGQSAFASIAEIVAILARDPDTDWSKVNISALREHLVDMNALTLDARVVQTSSEDEIVFTITGTGQTLRAIHAMVPAHSAQLDQITDWQVTAKTTPSGAIMTLSAADAVERTKIESLGFFGVMAIGAHHQAHHLAMARGNMH
ncbi:MAG: hypothetical protein P1V13_17615 [Rhizobiaceae bacterium]|nr:hypothetical protein [Rhizobiaceae bacterium]